jgi:hypothetical protein
MPEFVNPFSGKIPDRKLTDSELVRALRLDLAAEEEATHTYMAHAEATDNPIAKAVLIDIANEERVQSLIVRKYAAMTTSLILPPDLPARARILSSSRGLTRSR